MDALAADGAGEERRQWEQLLQQQRHDVLASRCERWLQQHPLSVEALETLGVALVCQGQVERGVARLREAQALAPTRRSVSTRLGVALERAGRHAEAIDVQRDALARFGDAPDLLYNLAVSLQNAGQTLEAIDCYQRCLQRQPDFAEAFNNLGVVLDRANFLHEAIDSFKRAIALRPEYLRPYVNLGRTLRAVGEFSEAMAYSQAALRRVPEHAPALGNLGLALADLGRYEEAIGTLQRAARLQPGLAQVHTGLGMALFHLGLREESLEQLEYAEQHCTLDPDSSAALGGAFFMTGHWQRAWRRMEGRHATLTDPTRVQWPDGVERWSGECRAGLPVLLVAEQGLGDTIQFARYGALLRERGVLPSLRCHPALVPLLSTSGLFCEVQPMDASASGYAAWYPLMSLPCLFDTSPDTVPRPTGYLAVPGACRARWRSRLDDSAQLRIGIAWQGNPAAEKRHLRGRSVPLSAFAALVALPGIRWYSLQYGAGSEQLEGVPFRSAITNALDAQADPPTDRLLDTAALVTALDLIISSDTMIAHLAGSLGVAAWIALHSTPDWRWGLQGERTPWYADTRLFRQRRAGDWSEVFEQMRERLQQVLSADPAVPLASRLRNERGV